MAAVLKAPPADTGAAKALDPEIVIKRLFLVSNNTAQLSWPLIRTGAMAGAAT